MIYVLDKYLVKHVFLMERYVLNKMHVQIIKINYHVMEVELMDYVPLHQLQLQLIH
jgi:hypothetical protein